jgi:hypothetical protein
VDADIGRHMNLRTNLEPSSLGLSSRRRLAKNRSGTSSAMMSAYIARSSRPIALIMAERGREFVLVLIAHPDRQHLENARTP